MFFRIQFLIDFYRILEAKWLPGALQKFVKNSKSRNKSRSGTRLLFGGASDMGFGMIWEGF